MEVQSTLLGKIREAQKDDKEIAEIKEKMSFYALVTILKHCMIRM